MPTKLTPRDASTEILILMRYFSTIDSNTMEYMDEDKVYTLQEVSDTLRVCTKKLREWTKNGDLESLRLRGRLRYSWQAVQNFLNKFSNKREE